MTEEDTSKSVLNDSLIVDQIKQLSTELAKISSRIASNEQSKMASEQENFELKKMISRLEMSVLDLGGNLKDEGMKIEGVKNTVCDECTLL